MIVLEKRSLIDFLQQLKKDKEETSENAQFLIILPDTIAIRNFSYATMSRGIAPATSQPVTFDDLAEQILDPGKTQGLRIVDRQTLGQLIAQTIKEASSGPLKDLQLIPFENPETQEALVDEFDEYLRGTDAGSLSSFLADLASHLDDRKSMAFFVNAA